MAWRPDARHRIGPLVVIAQALLAATAIVLLGSTSAYFQNLDEFTFSLFDLLPYLLGLTLAAAAALFAATMLVSLLLPSAGYWLIPAVALVLWLQGAFNVPAYGPLDGTPINWSAFRAEPVWEGVIVLAVAALLFLARRQVRQRPLLIPTALVVVFAVTAAAAAGSAQTMPEASTPPADVYRFSTTENVLLIVLDSFQTDALAEILQRHPAYREQLSGVTYYPNVVGLHPTTAPSIPALMLGRPYLNEQRIQRFRRLAVSESSVLADFAGQGFQVDLVYRASIDARHAADGMVDHAVPADHLALSWKNLFEEALSAFEYTMFRSSPQGVRKDLYWRGAWTLSSQVFRHYPKSARHRGDLQLVEQMERYAYAAGEQPVFKFIHLYTPHLPIVLDAGLNPVRRPLTREAYVDQAEAGLRMVIRLLDMLRRIGAYDSARILVVADHGHNGVPLRRDLLPSIQADAGAPGQQNIEAVISSGLPLFLAKPPGAAGAMAVDHSPVSSLDIAPSLADGLPVPRDRFSGLSVFSNTIPTDRRREFFHYRWSQLGWGAHFLEPMTVFEVSGHSWRRSSWRPVRTIVRDGKSTPLPRR